MVLFGSRAGLILEPPPRDIQSLRAQILHITAHTMAEFVEKTRIETGEGPGIVAARAFQPEGGDQYSGAPPSMPERSCSYLSSAIWYGQRPTMLRCCRPALLARVRVCLVAAVCDR